MGKITVEVKINTFGTMLYSLNHPKFFHSLKKHNSLHTLSRECVVMLIYNKDDKLAYFYRDE